MKGFEDHTKLHWKNTDKMLTGGFGVLADYLDISNAYSYWWNVSDDLPNPGTQNYGYYLIDEFASMATYFRKYTKGVSGSRTYFSNPVTYQSSIPTYEVDRSDIRHLVPGSSSDPDVIEYPEGEYWIEHPDWYKEYGSYGRIGYTARWDNFGGNTTGSGPLGTTFAPFLTKENRFVSADDPIDTDVWFIDAGPVVARRSTDGLWWGGLDPNSLSDQGVAWSTNYTADGTGYENRATNAGGHENQPGLRPVGSNTWSMQLSYGGIFGSLNAVSTDNLFNIGGFAGSTPTINSYYASNPKNTNFVKAIDSGAKFRWKEDPTGTVYTLSTNISQKRLLRHSTRRSKLVATQDGTSSGVPNPGYGATSMAEDLSFNFTSGFDLRNITPTCIGVWNPVQSGKITGGRRIELIAANSAGGTSGANTNTCTGNDPVNDDLSIFVPSWYEWL